MTTGDAISKELLGRRKVIFLTRSTSPGALTDSYYNTSSQAYETNLIRALDSLVDITVVYIGIDNSEVQKTLRRPFRIAAFKNHLQYCYFGKITLVQLPRFRRFLSELSNDRETSVVVSGYYPIELACLASIQKRNLNTFSIVFDTHKQGNSTMPLPKRWLANAYFEFGFFLLRYLSGIVVVNDTFVLAKRMKVRYHKTKIGKLFNGEPKGQVTSKVGSAAIRLLFAGTLNTDNGTQLILDYMDRHPTENIEVSFYGYGQLAVDIGRAALSDPRIRFGGILNDNELDLRLIDHDFLLCLRDPECPACQYAFPSKLIKFMGTGVPVICNAFPGLGVEYHRHLLILKEYSVDGIAHMISTIKGTKGDPIYAPEARAYIELNHDWNPIARQLIDFFAHPG